MSSLLTNGAAAGQRLNPNYLFLQAFGGVLSNKLEVSGGGSCCASGSRCACPASFGDVLSNKFEVR